MTEQNEDQAPPPTEAPANPYPYGATIRQAMNWEEQTLVKHYNKAKAKLAQANAAFRHAMIEERRAGEKLHQRGMLVALPAPLQPVNASTDADPPIVSAEETRPAD